MAIRPKLGGELKRRFKAQGYTMARVAKELGLFENSLRSWIRRNTFPQRELERIAAFVGFPKTIDTLEKAYDFALAGDRRTYARELLSLAQTENVDLAQAFEFIESGHKELLKHDQKVEQVLQVLFGALGENDVYVHWAIDVFPRELEPAGWAAVGREVTRAIAKGATLVYLYPGRQLVESARDRGLAHVVSAESILALLETLRSRLAAASPGISKQDLDKRVRSASYDEVLFAAPGHEYLLFGHGTESWDRHRLLVRQSIRTSMQETPLLLALDRNTTAAFVVAVRAALDRSEDKDLALSLG